MPLSKQFKALGRIAASFAAVWAVIGTGLSVLAGGPLLASFWTFGTLAGAVGGLSGLTTGLALARAESGRDLDEMPHWRAGAWGFLGGFGPAGLLSAIAVVFGPTPGIVAPLLALGLGSGGVVGAASVTMSVMSRRKRVSGGTDPHVIPRNSN